MKSKLLVILVFITNMAVAERLLPAKDANHRAAGYYDTAKEQTKKALFDKVVDKISNAADIGNYTAQVVLDNQELQFVPEVLDNLKKNGYTARRHADYLIISWKGAK